MHAELRSLPTLVCRQSHLGEDLLAPAPGSLQTLEGGTVVHSKLGQPRVSVDGVQPLCISWRPACARLLMRKLAVRSHAIRRRCAAPLPTVSVLAIRPCPARLLVWSKRAGAVESPRATGGRCERVGLRA